jgi:BlaI family penicillinase repressor
MLASATLCSATMFRAIKPPKRLSELEHLVMDILWARPQSTAEDVREALAGRHPMKDSTARTILQRLEGKGYVKHHVEGRTNVYRVSEPRRHLAVRSVQQIIDRLLGGSVEQLIVGMVDRDLLDQRELRRLAEKLARRKNRTRRGQDAD